MGYYKILSEIVKSVSKLFQWNFSRVSASENEPVKLKKRMPSYEQHNWCKTGNKME